jgi:hypothetical protein
MYTETLRRVYTLYKNQNILHFNLHTALECITHDEVCDIKVFNYCISLLRANKTIYKIVLDKIEMCLLLLLWLYNCLLGLGRFFSFLILYTVSRTPSTGD